MPADASGSAATRNTLRGISSILIESGARRFAGEPTAGRCRRLRRHRGPDAPSDLRSIQWANGCVQAAWLYQHAGLYHTLFTARIPWPKLPAVLQLHGVVSLAVSLM